MGGVGFADLSNQEHSNITLIGSAVRHVAVLKAVKTLGAERVCFGSDTPFALMHVERAAYHALLEGELTAEEEQQIMGGNIVRMFGIV